MFTEPQKQDAPTIGQEALVVVAPPTKKALSEPALRRADYPSLVEGHGYYLEFLDDEITLPATLTHFSEHPLGVGASFLVGKRRRFVYLSDIHHIVGSRICIKGAF